MPRMIGTGLSRREREILDILYRLGRASAAEVLEALSEPPSYSSVRALLRILEEKGHLRHEEEGKRYLYLPTQPQSTVAQNALKNVLRTFFGGRMENAVKAFLSDTEADLSNEELDRMAQLLEEARKTERE
ncbi:MAG TPA: BlaI/MecI/CopY family transcriptional regulator [Chthonomonadaceae bacterium]|nr:BlaI/MecI/CopY family transcriptional regulator [Chthonomonadaceae bacterium]